MSIIIKRIYVEDKIVPGKYFEVGHNKQKILLDQKIERFLSFKEIISTPYKYNGDCEYLKNDLVVDVIRIWNDGSIAEKTQQFLEDMGITKHRYNNWKLYQIVEGDFEDIKTLTFKELKEIVNKTKSLFRKERKIYGNESRCVRCNG